MSERFAFDKRLSLEKARIEAQLQKTNPGPQQNFLRRKLQEIERVSKLNKWLTCKKLQPPE